MILITLWEKAQASQVRGSDAHRYRSQWACLPEELVYSAGLRGPGVPY